MLKKEWKGFLYCLPVFLFMVVMCFYPLFDVFRTSLYKGSLPDFVGLENYKTMFQDLKFYSSLKTTFYFASLTVFFQLILGLIFASLLNQKIKFIALWRGLHFIPWVIPSAVAALVGLLIYQPATGLLSQIPSWMKIIDPKPSWLGNPSTALIAIIIVGVWKFFPFFTLHILAGMQNIPDELYEAAALDGANSWHKFFYLTIPHLRSTILTICVFNLIWSSSRVFDLVWIMTEGGPIGASRVLPVYIYQQMFWGDNIGYASAISIVFSLILMGFTLIYIVGMRRIED